MGFNRYFGQELAMLRLLGQKALAENPALAPFLKTFGADPEVERVIEAAAFLFARLEQKLDDGLPEILNPLFSLIWPHYLSPMPALSIIQYQAAPGVTGEIRIPKGTQVASVPVDGTSCRFSTVYDVDLLPLRVSGLQKTERLGEISLNLKLSITNGSLATLAFSGLKFHLGGKDGPDLYHLLLRHVKELRVVVKDDRQDDHIIARHDPSAIRHMGFGLNDGLFPYSESTSLPYRILQEYFTFPEKFLFVEISGLEGAARGAALQGLHGANAFELHFILQKRPEKFEAFRAEDWKLFCTPVVNLFSLADQPLVVGPGEVRIVPHSERPEHYAVYGVNTVAGWDTGGKKNASIENDLFSRHQQDASQQTMGFRLDIRPTLDGEKTEAYLSFRGVPAGELLRLDLTCTNGALPARLSIGDIHVPSGEGSLGSAPFANILPITMPSSVPCSQEVLWELLSNFSPNFIPLHDVEAFRAVIGTYHFRARHDAGCARALEQLLLSIVDIRSLETDRIVRGAPVRGLQTRITLDESRFAGTGEMYLFSSVLNAFLAVYASINSFHQCVVCLSRTGEQLVWPAVLGSKIM